MTDLRIAGKGLIDSRIDNLIEMFEYRIKNLETDSNRRREDVDSIARQGVIGERVLNVAIVDEITNAYLDSVKLNERIAAMKSILASIKESCGRVEKSS